jgi:hypothetical protein
MPQLNIYTHNGRIGHGYVIEFAGRRQHSIAWSDGPATRHKDDELKDIGIVCKHVSSVAPAESIKKTTVAEIEVEAEVSQVESEVEAQNSEFVFDRSRSEAENIRNYLAAHPEAENREVIAALHDLGMDVSSGQVTYQRNRLGNLEE